MNDEFYIKVYANCKLVKGVKRSAICDLQRGEIKLIPNDLYDLLVDNKLKIKEIKSKFNNKYDETITEYFTFLINNEFAFLTDTPNSFPELSNNWFESSIINNAILDYTENSYKILDVLLQLGKLNCKNIQIRFFKKTTITEIQIILDYLNKNQMFITSIDLLLPFIKGKNSDYQNLLHRNKRINSVIVYNHLKNDLIKIKKQFIAFVKEDITSQNNCGLISSSLFALTIKNYTESLKHNSCLNRKISIDTNGNIKNCPSMQQSFGNIKDTTLEEALNHKDFKKYWNITKDQIDVCKDCEFRYICTDCRAYIENPKDKFSKPLKCGYSPYTNKWSAWSTNPLKQKAIEYYGMQDLVKKNDA